MHGVYHPYPLSLAVVWHYERQQMAVTVVGHYVVLMVSVGLLLGDGSGLQDPIPTVFLDASDSEMSHVMR